MAEINDFGFTAVDQDELKTKTGEDASIGKEVADQPASDRRFHHSETVISGSQFP